MDVNNKPISTELDVSQSRPILDARNLTKYYRTPLTISNRQKRFAAVKDVSFSVDVQEFVALVGGSGAGKSTIAKMVLGIEEPDSGNVFFKGKSFDSFDKQDFKKFRKGCQAVFQDPRSALSPRMKVAALMQEPLKAHKIDNNGNWSLHAKEMLEKVGLSVEFMDRLPHELSGGQAQRVCIARALIAEPQLLICDEPTANLDVFTESEIVKLIVDLIDTNHMSLVFITHDISLVRQRAKQVAVMYAGKIVEIGDAKTVFSNPLHPYTDHLISYSAPQLMAKVSQNNPIVKIKTGEIPPVNGCDFAPLCKYVSDHCLSEIPQLEEIDSAHKVACWNWNDH